MKSPLRNDLLMSGIVCSSQLVSVAGVPKKIGGLCIMQVFGLQKYSGFGFDFHMIAWSGSVESNKLHLHHHNVRYKPQQLEGKSSKGGQISNNVSERTKSRL